MSDSERYAYAMDVLSEHKQRADKAEARVAELERALRTAVDHWSSAFAITACECDLDEDDAARERQAIAYCRAVLGPGRTRCGCGDSMCGDCAGARP